MAQGCVLNAHFGWTLWPGGGRGSTRSLTRPWCSLNGFLTSLGFEAKFDVAGCGKGSLPWDYGLLSSAWGRPFLVHMLELFFWYVLGVTHDPVDTHHIGQVNLLLEGVVGVNHAPGLVTVCLRLGYSYKRVLSKLNVLTIPRLFLR